MYNILEAKRIYLKKHKKIKKLHINTDDVNGDIINDYGMGGYFFSNANQRVDQLSHQIPAAINLIIIACALSLFIYFIFSKFKSLLSKLKESNQIKFLILCMVLYYPTFGLVFVFDRYLLLILILMILKINFLVQEEP